jgi:hypothetical protein
MTAFLNSEDALLDPLLVVCEEDDTTWSASSLPEEEEGEMESSASSLNLVPLLRREEEEEAPHFHPSLARSTDSHSAIPLVLFGLTLVAHGLFLYGQTAPMWSIRLTRNYNVWVNATTTQSKWAFSQLGLDPHQNFYAWQEEETLETYTFFYTVTELWTDTPGKSFARFTAILLVLCSGIWPHVKLILLNATMWRSFQSLQRRHFLLRVLSIAGKWSLVDVFTVCVFCAVLNFHWPVDPTKIQESILQDLPTLLHILSETYKPHHLCSRLLGYHCLRAKKFQHEAKCRACEQLVLEAYTHPQWAETTGIHILEGVQTSGDGHVHVGAVGETGISAFCLAVVLSIAIGLVVDALERRARHAGMPRNNSTTTLEEETSGSITIEQQDARPRKSWKRHTLPALTILMVLLAIFAPTTVRTAEGAIPALLGGNWEQPYSFWTLVRTTAGGGGILLSTMALFVIVGPAVRAALCVVPAAPWAHEIAAAFCGWEVLVVALFEVGMLVPKISDGLLWYRECKVMSGTCITVHLVETLHFVWVVLGGGLLLFYVRAVPLNSTIVPTMRYFEVRS